MKRSQRFRMTAAKICWAREFAVLAGRFAERPAVCDQSGEITYADLFRRAALLGRRLLDTGIRPGEPVATFLRNGIPAVWASCGVTLAGGGGNPPHPPPPRAHPGGFPPLPH